MHFAEIAGAFVSSARPTTSRLVPPSSGRDERLGRDVTPLPIGTATTPGRSVPIGGMTECSVNSAATLQMSEQWECAMRRWTDCTVQGLRDVMA